MSAATLPAEIRLVEQLAGLFSRSPVQCNARHEADAELVRLPGSATVLAITTDAISEEIASGLYADLDLIGWMTVLVNASDLAAVGAEPLGLVLNQTLPPKMPPADVERLQRGVAAASGAAGLSVLGGDTNFGPSLHMGATAIGLVTDGRLLTRRGAAPGDLLFASAPLGLGGAFAFARFAGGAIDPPAFRPQPRLAHGRLVRRYASCCMDTSDGVMTTLHELSRLNDVGFALDRPLGELLHPEAAAVARAAGLPLPLLLAGPHGEFELLFTLPREVVTECLRAAAMLGWEPLALGHVTTGAGLRIGTGRDSVALDAGAIREAYHDTGGDLDRYRAKLTELMGPASR
jgi:thiamine-monophosphate kinase